MSSRVVRLLVWNAMVHERVYAFSWPEMQRMFKRMQSLVQNNENTDQREGENMGEKEGEMMKQTEANQLNSGPKVYYPIRGRGSAPAASSDLHQQKMPRQSPSDITVDKRESFTEKKLAVTLEKAESLPGRKRSDDGSNEKNGSGGNCCGGAGAQQTYRRTLGLRHTRNDCCDTKAKQQSRNVNQKLIVTEHASSYEPIGDPNFNYLWVGLVISLILTFLGGVLYAAAQKQDAPRKRICGTRESNCICDSNRDSCLVGEGPAYSGLILCVVCGSSVFYWQNSIYFDPHEHYYHDQWTVGWMRKERRSYSCFRFTYGPCILLQSVQICRAGALALDCSKENQRKCGCPLPGESSGVDNNFLCPFIFYHICSFLYYSFFCYSTCYLGSFRLPGQSRCYTWPDVIEV